METFQSESRSAGTIEGNDEDGVRHSVKVAWRALALAEMELEEHEREKSSEEGR